MWVYLSRHVMNKVQRRSILKYTVSYFRKIFSYLIILAEGPPLGRKRKKCLSSRFKKHILVSLIAIVFYGKNGNKKKNGIRKIFSKKRAVLYA